MGMGLGRSLIASSLFLGLAANSFAASTNEIDELFREGVKLLRQHQDEKALEKFKAILRQDPANEKVYKLWRDSEETIWQRLLLKQGEYQKVAEAFINSATKEMRKRMNDADLIDGLISKCLSDDFATRRAASIKLMQDHGEYAVPALLKHLGNVDEENNQIYAQVAMIELGPQAVLPLLEALQTDNTVLRRNIVITLRRLGDTRALPELKLLADTDKDAMVKTVAANAISILGGAKGSAAELFVARANEFRSGRNIGRWEQSDVLWQWEKGELTCKQVSKLAFPFEVARQSAFKGLAANPSNNEAKVEIALSYLAERAAVAEQLAIGEADEALTELNNQLIKSQVVVASAGRDILRLAANKAVNNGDAFLCRMAFAALADVENADSLAGSPLIEALDNANSIIRTQAALTLADLDPQGIKSPVAKVSNILASAANNRLVRLVVSVGLNDNTSRSMPASFSNKYSIVEAANGPQCLNIVQPADIYVINHILPKLTVIDVVNQLRKRSATADKKILIVAKDIKKAKSDLEGLKVDGFLTEAAAAKLQDKIDETLKGFEVSLGRSRAVRLAKDAASKLASINARRFNLTAIEGKLINAASHEEDEVVLGIVKALAETGTAISIKPLADLAASERSLNVRISAARALGKVVSRNGKLTAEIIKSLTGVVGSDADLKLRAAVASALGQAKLDNAKRAELLELLRM